ncbi:phospholipid/cholesterol/gamma-HCH transport system substrate-binding protein [Nocardioides sp. J9]|uniref:MCE family protein n=1 Tax=Nocardioides sp. J9 TaxID=935844 RepID=UPI00119D3262|nr:MCE family protein [Nocardioides sp. J9]TWG94927.1 phospholipid/cholesterol/gamma-HCH transport system substrate-binding protein [Nocardioides sp. J9]
MNNTSPLKLRVAGVALSLLLVGIFVFTGLAFTRSLTNPAEVVLQTSRSGLIMEPGARVKYHGVEVGRVGKIRPVGRDVEIVLEIDRDHIDRIPGGVVGDIRATTVFGAKYVELLPGAEATTGSLAEGAVIRASGVTTEVNTVFDGLDRLLSSVDIAQLNSTLTVLARTLDGRGTDIAAVARKAESYLTRLEPLLPDLRKDLLAVAELADLGVEVSPALIKVLRNATVTARTLTTQDQALDQLLVSLSLLGGEATEFLGINGDALADLLRAARPTAETLNAYSSELPCLLQGLEANRKVMADVLGGESAGLRALVSIRSELPRYTYPKDLPGLPKGRGPNCYGLPKAEIPIPERGPEQ